jgi:hypothetical protein
MENSIRCAFASHKSAPNKKLAAIIQRVETRYSIDTAALEDDLLGGVNAAGELNIPLSQKENEDE